MKQLMQHLEKVKKIKRPKHHPLLHHVHKKYGISKKTLFYIKEYGPHSNVSHTIIKESLKIMLFAAVLSALGGSALESIKQVFVTLLPMIILLPVLNDMIGDFGTIVSSRFSTMLHAGEIDGQAWWKHKKLRELFAQVLIIAVIISIISAGFALFISNLSDFSVDLITMIKIMLIPVIDSIILVTVLTFTSISAGIYYFKKGEDPNNLLIPISTSIADLGNMIILASLVLLFF